MASGVLTGTQMIKQKFIQKRVEELTDGFKVTDAIFKAAPTDALSIVYEQQTGAESSPEDVEERAELGQYPRIGMDTDEKQAMIKDYGLEVMISWKAVNKNQVSSIDRAYIKLANSLIKFVDDLGFQTLTDGYNASSSLINTQAAGAAWGGTGADPFADILKAKSKVDNNQDQSYVANVAVVNSADYTNAMLNKDFRQMIDTDLAPNDKIVRSGLIKGKVAGVTIIAAHNMRQGNAWVGQSQIVGDRNENTQGIETDLYRENNSKKAPYIVSSFREFVDTLTDPKAGTLLTGL
jgi:hypothetical protein